MTNPIYAIGDIHGHLDKLDRALDLIDRDGGRGATIVCIGDYIDRGPNSQGVINRLIAEQKTRGLIALKGNHDRMMEWFLETPPRHDPQMLVGYHWLHEKLGGIETMASYGIEVRPGVDRLDAIHSQALEHVSSTHVEFLKNLRLSYEIGDYFFAHAGIRPNVALSQQVENDLVWIRQDFHAYTDPHPKFIVHGHTPVKYPTLYPNRLNIDGGAAFGRDLVPVVLEGNDVFAIDNTGRVKLTLGG